jgi:hypothetical protein
MVGPAGNLSTSIEREFSIATSKYSKKGRLSKDRKIYCVETNKIEEAECLNPYNVANKISEKSDVNS